MSNKAKRLRVLHVIPSVASCRGGPSEAIIGMVSALRKTGIDAEIATTNDNGETELNVELNTLVDHQGIPVRFFKRYSPPLRFAREFTYSKPFSIWLTEHIRDYDLVHVHAIFSYCSSYAMSVARRNSIPYIVRPIGQLETWSLKQSKLKKALYLRVIEKANIEGASAVHFTADSERDEALKTFADLKAYVIPLGVKAPKLIPEASKLAFDYWQIPEHSPCLVFLSRLHPKKGIEFLLNAVRNCNLHDAQLVIAGSGDISYMKELQSLCTKLGITNQCRFIGFIKGQNKNILLQRADLFCLTSYSENFGISALEAMANGTAPLLSRHVALADQVKHHGLGYTCELNQNDVNDKLKLALDNQLNTRKLGSNARRFVVKHYQWLNVAQRLSALYQQQAV